MKRCTTSDYKEEFFLRMLLNTEYTGYRENCGTTMDFVNELIRKGNKLKLNPVRISMILFVNKMKNLGIIEHLVTKIHNGHNQMRPHYKVNLDKLDEYIINNKLFELDIRYYKKRFSNQIYIDDLPY